MTNDTWAIVKENLETGRVATEDMGYYSRESALARVHELEPGTESGAEPVTVYTVVTESARQKAMFLEAVRLIADHIGTQPTRKNTDLSAAIGIIERETQRIGTL